jgi:hypothetical protein
MDFVLGEDSSCYPGRVEVVRTKGFSPLKNAPGTGADAPEMSRGNLLAQHRRFLEASDATVREDIEIELLLLMLYAGEGLSEYHRSSECERKGSPLFERPQ